MRVAVKLFAIARERAGTAQAWVELTPDATVTDALDELGRCFPKLPLVLTRAMVAVNREYAERTHVLRDGDELAVIPPVSGGALFCHSEPTLPTGRDQGKLREESVPFVMNGGAP